jgi:hypothetical protein
MRKILLCAIALGSSVAGFSQTFTAGTMYPQYTDINPDQLMYYVYFPYIHLDYNIDMFSPAGDEIQVTSDGASSSGGSSAYINIKCLSPDVYVSMGRLDSVYDSTSTSWLVTKVAKPLNAGDPINSSGAVWVNAMQYISDHSASFGWMKDVNDWIGGDKYVGVKYMGTAGTWYGWIRLQCFKKDSCYVKDFSSAMTGVGVGEIAGEQMTVYPNPVKDAIYLDKTDAAAFDVNKLRLTDLAGREIKFNTEIAVDRVKLVTAELADGCYLLNYTDERSSWSRKIIVSKR